MPAVAGVIAGIVTGGGAVLETILVCAEAIVRSELSLSGLGVTSRWGAGFFSCDAALRSKFMPHGSHGITMVRILWIWSA